MSKRDMFNIDPRIIEIEPGYNVRDLGTPSARAALDILKGSISEIGLKQPLQVRRDGARIVLVQGHRRLTCVMELIEDGTCDFKSVPCFLEDRHTSVEERTLDLITSNSGEPLTPLERAEAVKRLVSGFGWTTAQVAAKLGVTYQSVHNWLTVASAPESLKVEIRAGTLSASTATDLVRKHGDEAGNALKAIKGIAPSQPMAFEIEGGEADTPVPVQNKKRNKPERITQRAVNVAHGDILSTLKPKDISLLVDTLRWAVAADGVEPNGTIAARINRVLKRLNLLASETSNEEVEHRKERCGASPRYDLT
jgi:ParB/RepB/Spo0J family partition protein